MFAGHLGCSHVSILLLLLFVTGLQPSTFFKLAQPRLLSTNFKSPSVLIGGLAVRWGLSTLRGSAASCVCVCVCLRSDPPLGPQRGSTQPAVPAAGGSQLILPAEPCEAPLCFLLQTRSGCRQTLQPWLAITFTPPGHSQPGSGLRPSQATIKLKVGRKRLDGGGREGVSWENCVTWIPPQCVSGEKVARWGDELMEGRSWTGALALCKQSRIWTRPLSAS